jgi:quercetin dioxygenase-like cupin family protein
MRIARITDTAAEAMSTDTFAGRVSRRDLGRVEMIDGTALAVTFEPGARTDWHRHTSGQVLFVIEGAGRVGTRDGQVAEIGSGDLVEAPPDEEHWHGASEHGPVTHLALSLGETIWLEPVGER